MRMDTNEPYLLRLRAISEDYAAMFAKKEQPTVSEEERVITPEVMPDGPPPEPGAVVPWNRFQNEFRRFKDKFVGLEASHEDRRNNIITKMERRDILLEEIEDLLDTENSNLEAFKKKQLGK